MLIAAAVWSVVVLLAAGLSLQALYGSETNRLLDSTVDDTLATLTNAVTANSDGSIQFDQLKRPRAERFDQLDLGVRKLDENHPHAMLRQGHGRAHLGAKRITIECARSRGIPDRDGDMIQPPDHAFRSCPRSHLDHQDMDHRPLSPCGGDRASHRFFDCDGDNIRIAPLWASQLIEGLKQRVIDDSIYRSAITSSRRRVRRDC